MASKKPKTQPAQARAGVTRRQFVATVGGAAGAVAFNQRLLAAEGGIATAGTETTAAEIREPKNAVATNLTINGRPHCVSIDPRLTLLDLLRENLGLTGTKKGCDRGQCGACTVLVQGVRINSCLALAVTLDGENVTTIEGLSPSGRLHPLQAAFVEHDGLQCGYCTPGQICSAVGLLREAENGQASFVTDLSRPGPIELTRDEIRERMSGNICRCGAYPGIIAAVESVSRSGSGPVRGGGEQ